MRNLIETSRRFLLIAVISVVAVSCYTMKVKPPDKVSQAEYSSKVLHKVIFDYVEESLYTYPHLATRLGMHIRKLQSTEVIRLDRELPNFSEDLVNARLDKLGQLKEILNEKVPAEVLSLNDQADLRLISDAIDLEFLRMGQDKIFTNDPLLHVRALAEGLYFPLVLEYAPEEARLADLLGRMHWVPSFVDRAIRLLAMSSDLNRVAAIEINAWTISLLKGEIATKMLKYPNLQESYEGMRTPSLDALNRLQSFLVNDLKKKPRIAWQQDEQKYNNYFALVFHGLTTPKQAAEHAEKRIVAIRESMFEVAKPFYCNANKADRKTCNEKKAAPVSDEVNAISAEEAVSKKHNLAVNKVIAWALRGIDKSRAINSPISNLKQQLQYSADQAAERKVLSSTGVTGLTVDTMPEFLLATGHVFSFDTQPAFQPDQGARIFVASSQQAASLTARSKSRMFFTSSRYASPGKFELFKRTVEMENQTRRAIRVLHADAAYVEGWALYMATQLSAKVEADGKPWEQKIVALAEELQAGMELLVDVGLHTGMMKDADAVSMLKKRAHMSAAMAKNAIFRVKFEPTSLAAPFIGLHVFNETYKAFSKGAEEQSGLNDFHDKAVSFGPIPIMLLGDFFETDPDYVLEDDVMIDNEELEKTVTIIDLITQNK